MKNAKRELLNEVGDREVEHIRIVFIETGKPALHIYGTLETVLSQLDFDYDDKSGWQNLLGYIWYKDGTWSERVDYTAYKLWIHKSVPPFDIEIRY